MKYRTFQVHTGPSAFPADVVVTEEELFTLDHCDGCGAHTGPGLCSNCQAEDERSHTSRTSHLR